MFPADAGISRAVRGRSLHLLETLAAQDARTVQPDEKQFGLVTKRLELLLKKDAENQGGRAAVAQKLAEFQHDPKAWLAANLNPALGEHAPKGYEAFSNATVDWNIWAPGQTSTSGTGRDTATAQENAKAALKE